MSGGDSNTLSAPQYIISPSTVYTVLAPQYSFKVVGILGMGHCK